MSDIINRLRDLGEDRDACARLAAGAVLKGDDEGAHYYAERYRKFATAHEAAHAELIASVRESAGA